MRQLYRLDFFNRKSSILEKCNQVVLVSISAHKLQDSFSGLIVARTFPAKKNGV